MVEGKGEETDRKNKEVVGLAKRRSFLSLSLLGYRFFST